LLFSSFDFHFLCWGVFSFFFLPPTSFFFFFFLSFFLLVVLLFYERIGGVSRELTAAARRCGATGATASVCATHVVGSSPPLHIPVLKSPSALAQTLSSCT
jgi:hypothetical protein